MKTILISYIIIINLIGLFLMGIDKRKAIKGRWRIAERTLMITALLFGSVGILIGMYLFRHKTRHLKFALGIPVILVLQLFAVSFLFTWNANRMDSPSRAVRHELDLIRSLDESTIQAYISYDHLTKASASSAAVEEEAAEAVRLFFQNFKYKILSETIQDDQAEVLVSIQNLDMNALSADLCAQITRQSAALFPDENASDRNYYRLLRDTLRLGDYKLTETTACFHLNKKESGWVIQIDDALEDQLVSGFISCMNNPYLLSSAEVLEIQLDALKELDARQWMEYLDLHDVFATYSETYASLIDEEYTEQLAKFFDYEILRCSESGNKAAAAVRIHSIDMEHVLSIYKEYLLTYASSGRSLRDDPEVFASETARLLLQALQENTRTAAIDLDLIFYNNGAAWQLYFDEAFTDAVMGGMEHAMDIFTETTHNADSRIISPAREAQ